MSTPREVLWAQTAEKDLHGVIEVIRQDRPETAIKILERIQARATKLATSPRQGRVVPELMKQGVSRYRELLVKPWRIVYRIEDSRVYVLAVIDGRRNIEDLLLARLLR